MRLFFLFLSSLNSFHSYEIGRDKPAPLIFLFFHSPIYSFVFLSITLRSFLRKLLSASIKSNIIAINVGENDIYYGKAFDSSFAQRLNIVGGLKLNLVNPIECHLQYSHIISCIFIAFLIPFIHLLYILGYSRKLPIIHFFSEQNYFISFYNFLSFYLLLDKRNIDTVILPFEGRYWELFFIFQSNQFNIRNIAYVHSIPTSRNSRIFSVFGAQQVLDPTYISLPSERLFDLFRNHGWPSSRLLLFGFLKKYPSISISSNRHIVLALSGDYTTDVRLVSCITHNNDYPIFIKSNPRVKISYLLRDIIDRKGFTFTQYISSSSIVVSISPAFYLECVSSSISSILLVYKYDFFTKNILSTVGLHFSEYDFQSSFNLSPQCYFLNNFLFDKDVLYHFTSDKDKLNHVSKVLISIGANLCYR